MSVAGQAKPKRVPFAEGWLRFASEALGDWLRLDLGHLLTSSVGLEDKVKAVHHEFLQRPEDADAFRKSIGSQRKAKEPPPIENSIRMCGAMNAVMVVILCKLGDVLDSKILPKDPLSGLPQGTPQSLLPYLTRARATFAQDDSHYRDSAFAAALIFDLLAFDIQGEPSAEVRTKSQAALDIGFDRALASIRIGMALARQMKRLALEGELPSAILLHEAGIAAAACYVTGYADACRDWEKRTVPPSVRLADELERFGSIACAFSEACSWIAPVLAVGGGVAGGISTSFSLVLPKDRDTADLSSLCSLAIYCQSHPDLLAGTVPTKAGKIRPDLAHLDLTFIPSQVAKDAANSEKNT